MGSCYPPSVAKELLAVVDVDDSPSAEVPPPPKLQLSITFEVPHHRDMAERSRSLSTKKLDLVKFLIVQVASLSSSMACVAVFAESSAPPPVECEVVDL
jgi:hypothetical protein